ncbi:Uncharacterised protein [Mycobacterium tuberculosis]|nr:Uncharacterised protein [Mycobacterium tuberculosis]
MANVTSRNTAIDPTTASTAWAIGSPAANSPPNTQISTRKLSGIAINSITSRSSLFCRLIWAYSIAEPPARTVTPSRSWATSSDRVWAWFCASFSPPLTLTTINPDFPSVLSRSAAAVGGTVHGEVTL